MSLSLPIHSGESAPSKRTALVVDDVDDMLDLLEIALSAADFSVLRASSAEDALELFEARSGEIDLLMTDVRVGSDSGLELAQSLLESKPSLQVLAISGFALDGTVVSGRGKIDFLPKPFSTSDLKRKLQAIFPSPPPSARLTVTISGGANGHYTVSTNCSVPREGKREKRPPEFGGFGGRRLA
jgi:DNA-binding response OmpR family regulator